ncbi:hypothetical protein [Paracraurococcus lichenis]|uniref:Uncharacterized protein n=1 Tax=Paracraurococcus lichenis TaxID=3064888 RepID=A0ABT9DW59_9PROT|nr:hypothetical protein [Paracraurococcus sp. LOR1-02]MDO9708108.1 hypothetical protein [Paracraurococcus sp. LOR1-02]
MPTPPLRAALLALLLLLAPGARAGEVAWWEPLWLQPPGADVPFPALLSLPAGWQPGDAAVVLLPDGPAPTPLRLRLVEALLAAEAAVLELDPHAARAGVPGLSPVAALPPADAGPALRAALQALQAETGAGLLVAIGLGPAGETALRAAEEPAPSLAAAAALGGPLRIAAGAPPAAGQRWDLRAPLLCALLAGAAEEPAARGRCEGALLGPPARRPALARLDPAPPRSP